MSVAAARLAKAAAPGDRKQIFGMKSQATIFILL
jgi:hypothetical protein